MGGVKTTGIGRYEVPQVHLSRQTFEGDEAKLQKLNLDLIQIEAGLKSTNPDLNKAYADLLSAVDTAGINQSNLGDFKAKYSRLAEFLYQILFRISDGFAGRLETERALEVLVYFATVSNGDVVAFDPARVQDLQPLAKPKCGYTNDRSRTWAEERYQELLAGLYNPENACQGVQMCENPTEFHYSLQVKRDTSSGNITLSGETQGFERLDLDIFCGIEKRDSMHLIANPEEKFVTGAIAQCAGDATMALRWKASHPLWCSRGIGAAVLPPSVDPDKVIAKRPNLEIPPVPKEIVDLIKPEGEAKKIQLVFLVDASASMDDDIQALQNLLQEIVAILQAQASEEEGLQMGLWHVAGGSNSSEQDLPLTSRESGRLAGVFSNVFDQILKGMGGGNEPLWQTLLQMMGKENWSRDKDVYRKIVVLSDEWSNADSAEEPIQVAKMAKEKGIEIKVRGPAAVAYELAKLVVEGVIYVGDYDKVVVREGNKWDGYETRIKEAALIQLCNRLLNPEQREKLTALYDNFKSGELKIPSTGREKIDLTLAILDSEDEKIRLQTLRGAMEHFQKAQDPEQFDLIAAYLKDQEAVIRKEAVGFFIDTKLPNSLRLKYAPQLAERLADENSEVRKLSVKAVCQTIQEGVSVKEKGKYGEAIAKLLKDHRPEVRATALQNLALLAGEKYADAITSALNDPDPAVRKKAVEIMGALSIETRTKNLDQILAKLKDESAEVRAAAQKMAVSVAAKIPRESTKLKIADTVVGTFGEEEGSKEALGAIFNALSQEGKNLLIKMTAKNLEHPDAKIRASAVWALNILIANILDARDLLVLTGRIVKLLADKEVTVRKAAYDVLKDPSYSYVVVKRLGWWVEDWLGTADLEDRKYTVLALGVLVPDIGNSNERMIYATILADQLKPSGSWDSFLKAIGFRKPDAEYEKIIHKALANISPTLKGKPVSVLVPPASGLPGEKTVSRKEPHPVKSAFNIRDYFEEAPADQPLYVNHRFIHYFSPRPWEKASRDLQGLSKEPAPTEEVWMCVEGETPAGPKSQCYEIGIAETATSARPYIESPFTRGIQEEFSNVTAMSHVHFHPKAPAGARGDEYPSHVDFGHLLQQVLVAKGLNYPEKGFSLRVVTSTGVFTMKPDFKKINDHFGNAQSWVGDYFQILAKFIVEGPEFAGLTQVEKSKRFVQEINTKVSPYVMMEFKEL